MAHVDIFSNEFFGFAVPDYSPTTPESDLSPDSLTNRISTLSVNESDVTPTGTRRRHTSGPVEHEMPHGDSLDDNNPDTNSDASASLSDDGRSVPTEDEAIASIPTHDPGTCDSANNHIETNTDTPENETHHCNCESPENVIEDIGELKTNIEFQLTRSHKENSGFSLMSSRSSGHMISVIDNDNSHVQHMNLQTGDSIVGIKNVDVRLYDHHVLVSVLQHIYGEDSGVFKMVIGRTVETDGGRDEVRYIEINVQFEFPTRELSPMSQNQLIWNNLSVIFYKTDYDEVFLLKIDARSGDTSLRMNVSVVTCSSLTFSKIMCVEYQDSKLCWIKNNDHYLSTEDNQLTTSNPFPGKYDVRFQFQWWTFHGLEARTVGNMMCPSVIFCAFKSLHSDTFVTVMSGNRVGIGKSSSLSRDISMVRKPDCRFFKVRQMENGKYLLESLVYEGVYLMCGRKGLSMKKTKSVLNDIFRIPQGLLFDIFTSNDNH